ncbi:MAG: bifunctional phosphoribosyl-AMP cyclohydrolase/phosphoribosyl-ATP diphosphatase HisIE [Polyangiaceae bacterium]
MTVASLDLDRVDFAKGGGTVTVVAQDADTRAVLMVAYADREALERSIATGDLHFRSRTRGLWRKGETSGHVLRVVSLAADCDHDAILATVRPAGPTCHTGATTCWGEPEPARGAAIAELARTIEARRAEPTPASYTAKLLADRNLRLKKIGEEATELAVALADRDSARAAEEAADVIYHALVALAAEGITLDEVERVLASRRR